MGKKKRKSIPTTQPKDKNLDGNCGTISARTEILGITDAKQKQK